MNTENHSPQEDQPNVTIPVDEAIRNVASGLTAHPYANENTQAAISRPVTEQSVVSIPNSLREQLQRVQLLINQSEHAKANGYDDAALSKARQAVGVMNNLVNRSTESATLAILADMGCQGYEFGTVEETESYVIVERKVFGLSFGTFVTPTRTVIRRNSQGSSLLISRGALNLRKLLGSI